MLWHSAQTLNSGTMPWSTQTHERFLCFGKKYMIYNRNHLYSRAIHCPASMEMHYVQWFLCFGTRPRHQTRAPWLGPPRLKKAKYAGSRIFDVSSSTGLRIEGYLTCWKDELGNHTLGMNAQNMHQLRVLGAKQQALYFLPLVPMLWHSAQTPNPGTMPWSTQTHDGKM